jgi:uncharacterized membrane protein YbhN (UPF0104 family)
MLVVLLAMVTATGPLTARLLHLASPEWWPLLFMLAGVAGLAALMLADRVASRFAHWRIIGFLAALSADTRRLAASRWTLPMLVLCALGNLNFVAAAWLLGQALGLALPFADYLAFMPLVVVVTVLPVSVGGWGLREGLLVALLAHVGIPAHNALAFSLLFGACSAVGSLPGLALWWLRAEPARVALA